MRKYSLVLIPIIALSIAFRLAPPTPPVPVPTRTTVPLQQTVTPSPQPSSTFTPFPTPTQEILPINARMRVVAPAGMNARKTAGMSGQYVMALAKGTPLVISESRLIGSQVWGRIVSGPATGLWCLLYDDHQVFVKGD